MNKVCHKNPGVSSKYSPKFELPVIPKSGVPGVTYKRAYKRWEVRIKEAGRKKMKYVGAFKTLKEALKFQSELLSISV